MKLLRPDLVRFDRQKDCAFGHFFGFMVLNEVISTFANLSAPVWREALSARTIAKQKLYQPLNAHIEAIGMNLQE